MLDGVIVKMILGGGLSALVAAVAYVWGKYLDHKEPADRARAKYIEDLQKTIDWQTSQIRGLQVQVNKLQLALNWISRQNHKLRLIIYRCAQKFPVTATWLEEQLSELEGDEQMGMTFTDTKGK